MESKIVSRRSPVARVVATTAPTIVQVWQRVITAPADWAYVAVGKRDMRLDVLRGFAVLAMVVNHMGGASWLYPITGANRFWVSAAEAFVVLSGLIVGMVYGGIALKEGLRVAQIKALKRAFTLYKLTVVLTLVSMLVASTFKFPWAQDVPYDSPVEFIINVLTLRQVVYLTDIPLMYTLFLLAAPIALWLLVRGRTGFLLALSAVIWATAYATRQYMPWTVVGGWSFNLGSWQFLFLLAMVIGFHWDALKQKLAAIPRVPYFLFSATLLVWFIQFYNSDVTFVNAYLPGWDINTILFELFRKSVVGPGRLLATLIFFQFAYLALTLLWKPLAAAFGWLLVPLGQNSLYGYTMHLVLIGVFTLFTPLWGTEWHEVEALNTALQLMTVLAIWAMVRSKFLFNVVPR